MTSDDLTRRGFGGWIRFNRQNELAVLAALPSDPGVYCVRSTVERYPLSLGTSDILYIGSATNSGGLQLRVRQYFHPGPTQWTNKRLLTRCADSDGYEVGHVTTARVQAKALEFELLSTFLSLHGQLPPENRRLPDPPSAVAIPIDASKARRMYDAVTEAPMGPKTRHTLEAFVAAGDCEGLLAYLENCIANQKDVGRSIKAAGRVSFESRIGDVRRIFRDDA